MLLASELRKGSKFSFNGEPYEVIDFQKFIMGRGRGNIHIKMKNMRNGRVQEKTFSTDEKFEDVDLVSVQMQYLYSDGEGYTFMDSNTYEQLSFSDSQIGNAKWFIKEGNTYKVLLLDGEPLTVDIPASVELQIAETEPAVKGDSVTNIYKKAVTNTGLEIKVPLFIEQGEFVKVDTRTLDYIGRAK